MLPALTAMIPLLRWPYVRGKWHRNTNLVAPEPGLSLTSRTLWCLPRSLGHPSAEIGNLDGLDEIAKGLGHSVPLGGGAEHDQRSSGAIERRRHGFDRFIAGDGRRRVRRREEPTVCFVRRDIFRQFDVRRAWTSGAHLLERIEGLSANSDHPLQKAWIAEQVPQCGYCQSGQIMMAADLLAKNKSPTREHIVRHMNGNICRCGTYSRIVRAIQRAAREA